MTHALCREAPEIFTGEKDNFSLCRTFCRRCPVRTECLALGLFEESGIWGGLDPLERKRLRKAAGSTKQIQQAPPYPSPPPVAASIQAVERVPPDDIAALKVSPMTSKQVVDNSHGEVRKAETLNYRTYKPVRQGLFAEEIFGPETDLTCSCGKVWKITELGRVCAKCEVRVGLALSRRARFGHIQLASPVAHPLFLWSNPSPIALALAIKRKQAVSITRGTTLVVGPECTTSWMTVLDRVEEARDSLKLAFHELLQRFDDGKITRARFTRYERAVTGDSKNLKTFLDQSLPRIVRLAAQNSHLQTGQLLSLDTARLLEMLNIEAGLIGGAEGLRFLLGSLDVESELRRLSAGLASGTISPQLSKLQRLQLLEEWNRTNFQPQDLILDALPVLPPALRPIVRQGDKVFLSDLNIHYSRILNVNEALHRQTPRVSSALLDAFAKARLQIAVDEMFGESPHELEWRKWHPFIKKRLRTLSSAVGESFGRAPKGKSVDFSCRLPTLPNPNLKIGECIVPGHQLVDFFRPFDLAAVKGVRRFSDELRAESVLGRELIVSKIPPLNQAQILGVRITGLSRIAALQLHPLVLRSLGVAAGGPVAFYLPLGTQARKEVSSLMNAGGASLWVGPGSAFSSDPDVESYVKHLTSNERAGAYARWFKFASDAISAHDRQALGLRSPIVITTPAKTRTTVGRVMLAQLLRLELHAINSEFSAAELGEIMKARCTPDVQRNAVETIVAKAKSVGVAEEEVGWSPPLNPYDFWISARDRRRQAIGVEATKRTLLDLLRDMVFVLSDATVVLDDCRSEDYLRFRWSGSAPRGLIGRSVHTASGHLETVTEAHLESWFVKSTEVVEIRSLLGCKAEGGFCQTCYGIPADLGRRAYVGEPIGVDAAQGLMTPLMKPAMSPALVRNYYLDEVLNLALARVPKRSAPLAPISGTVEIVEAAPGWVVTLIGRGAKHSIVLRSDEVPLVVDGQKVEAGYPLSEGQIDPHHLLTLSGPRPLAELLLGNFARAAEPVAVPLQHGELLIASLLSLSRVIEPGLAPVREGDFISESVRNDHEARGRPLGSVSPAFLSLKDVSRRTESWLVAATRGRTARTLAEASLQASVAPLNSVRARMMVGASGRTADWFSAPEHPAGDELRP